MDPRRFEAWTRALSTNRPVASRRRLLAAIPAIAAAVVGPTIVRAFDAGVVQRPLAPGDIPCTGGADCPAGQVCINGVCGTVASIGGAESATEAPAVSPAAVAQTPTLNAGQTPTPRAIVTPNDELTPAAAAATPATSTPAPAVGGGAIMEDPLPAAIYRGTCGALEPDAAFSLIDIGTEQTTAAPALPQGAPSVAGADFSSTIVSTAVADLLTEPYAIDVRLNADDPASSIVCGNITGTLDAANPTPEIVLPLEEQNSSGASGVAWLRQEAGGRSLAYVFVSRPDEAPTGSGEQTPTAVPTVASDVAAFQRGDTVVTLFDVNLRAAPSTEAAIVEVLGTGVELEVTVDERDGWVPVVEADGTARGFVAAETVEQA